MTPEEMRKKLREAGIQVGEGWQEEKEHYAKSPIIEKQKKLLGNVQDLLEKQVAEDQAKIAELHIALQRIKHGGGA